MKNLLVRLGQRIRDLRVQRGWSQEEFAEVVGVHRTYMGHLERGEKNVSFGSLLRLAESLGITLSELLDGLESGSSSRLKGLPQPPLSRERLLREVARLELVVKGLKQLAAPREKKV